MNKQTEADIQRMKELMRYVPGSHPDDLLPPEGKTDGDDIIDPKARKKETELFDPDTPKDDGLRPRDDARPESGNAIGPQLLNEEC